MAGAAADEIVNELDNLGRTIQETTSYVSDSIDRVQHSIDEGFGALINAMKEPLQRKRKLNVTTASHDVSSSIASSSPSSQHWLITYTSLTESKSLTTTTIVIAVHPAKWILEYARHPASFPRFQNLIVALPLSSDLTLAEVEQLKLSLSVTK